MSALNFPIALAHHPHTVVFTGTSWLTFVALLRSYEERARAGRAISIGIVERYARRAREVVRSTAYRPAHPVDGSRPHSWARRIFLDGENGGARAGMPTHMPAPCLRPRDVRRASALTVCTVAVRRQGATLTPPAATSPALSLGPLQLLSRMFVSQPFRGRVWVPRVPQSVLCVRSRRAYAAE